MPNSMEQLQPAKPTTNRRPQFGKLEFSSIQSFIEDARHDDVETVHLDVFEMSQQSELSFVYYVTMTIFLTAEDDQQRLLYEYAEEIGTATSTDRRCTDDEIVRQAKNRVKEIEELLRCEGFDVRHGRLTVGRKA